MLPGWITRRFTIIATLVAAGLITLVISAFYNTDDAEARRRGSHYRVAKKHHVHHSRGRHSRLRRGARSSRGSDASGNPRYAGIVVDAKTGKILYQSSPDALRHPASITKVMTLYMLFEQMKAGRVTLATRMPVSAHAAAQPPTKLGLKPGTTLRVDEAIKGIVTRSANDAAVVIAEYLGGSESNFSAMMTRKARSLGMSRTTFHNASGLPDAAQITTARDLAVLGMAVQARFPTYFKFFSTRSFVFRGRGINGHNRLLGQVEGVDGIKTGYTRSSGYNLLTSVRRDNRQIVAVVLGGRSGASRDATMRSLIADNMPNAYAGATRRAPLAVAQAAPVSTTTTTRGPVKAAVVAERARQQEKAPVALAGHVARYDADTTVALPTRRPADIARPTITATAAATPTMRWNTGPAPAVKRQSDDRSARALAAAFQASESSGVRLTTVRVRTTSEPASDDTDEGNEDVTASSPVRTGWIIQIGAAESKDGANLLLARAQDAGLRSLKAAQPFTETVEHDGTTLWRARFAGFSGKRQALAACSALKSKSFACLAVQL